MMYFVTRVNFNATTGKQSNSIQMYTDLVAAQKRFYTLLAADIDSADYSYELVQIVDERGAVLASQVFDNREPAPVQEGGAD
jgi:hypothetical protein